MYFKKGLGFEVFGFFKYRFRRRNEESLKCRFFFWGWGGEEYLGNGV